jgi:hypothetical protein
LSVAGFRPVQSDRRDIAVFLFQNWLGHRSVLLLIFPTVEKPLAVCQRERDLLDIFLPLNFTNVCRYSLVYSVGW